MIEKITLEDILEVNELDTDEMKSYYHIPEECMVVISKEDIDYVKSGKDINLLEDWKIETALIAKAYLDNKKDFLNFPSNDDYNEEDIIPRFIESLKSDKDNYNKLKKSIEDGVSVKKFKDELYSVNLVDEWYDFREIEYKKVAQKWCEVNNISYEKSNL